MPWIRFSGEIKNDKVSTMHESVEKQGPRHQFIRPVFQVSLIPMHKIVKRKGVIL